jgi:hypothetical protein
VGIPVAIAIEDALSEVVWGCVIKHARRDLTISARYPETELPGGRHNPRNVREARGLSGFGQLRVRLPAFNHAAASGEPFFVLADLDVHAQCPGQVLPLWMPNIRRSRNLVFRVAVREVEAWLLADKVNFADFLAVDPAHLPGRIELVTDPKLEIVRLARLSTSADVVNDLVPRLGSTAEVGRLFERSLLTFARHHWNIDEAARHSRSLRRALRAIVRFKPA